jgi:hypothetical protein
MRSSSKKPIFTSNENCVIEEPKNPTSIRRRA